MKAWVLLAAWALSGQEADRLDAVTRAYHEAGRFDGAVVVARAGEVRFARGYGFANRDWLVANGPDVRYRLSGYWEGLGISGGDLEDRLFRPLRMGSTGWDDGWQVVRRRASGYLANGEPSAFRAGFSTSALDLVKWLEGTDLIQAGAARAVPDGAEAGFAWAVRRRADWIVVVLANRQVDQAGLADALMAVVEGREPLLPEERAWVKLNVPMMERYTGRYDLGDGRVAEFTREGFDLYLQVTGEPRFRLRATSETTMVNPVLDVSIELELDEWSIARGMRYRSGGGRGGGVRWGPRRDGER
jgi:CubicO group peptidase (beta-lactamase class C family)